MTNTMASIGGKAFQCTKPISSAYVVMLKRYLLRLKEQLTVVNVQQPNLSAEYGNTSVALEHISPLIREIESLSDNATFGLDIGQLMHPSDYGIFGYAMMNCETLMSALRTACEHKNMLNREFSASFLSDENHVIYSVETEIKSRDIQILIELDFSTAFEFAQRLAGPNHSELTLCSVHFAHQALGEHKHYLRRFKCPVYFNAPNNQIRIEKTVLETPIYGANPKVLSFLEDKIGLLTHHAKNDSIQLKEQVSCLVNSKLGDELPSAQLVAKHFHMSLSSFKKRLHAEGACYQHLCDQVRYRRCRELMQTRSLPIKSIAFKLGFTNPSAFNRAFKRWSGESPSAYLKRLHVNKIT